MFNKSEAQASLFDFNSSNVKNTNGVTQSMA